jgi:hypothetical protein
MGRTEMSANSEKDSALVVRAEAMESQELRQLVRRLLALQEFSLRAGRASTSEIVVRQALLCAKEKLGFGFVSGYLSDENQVSGVAGTDASGTLVDLGDYRKPRLHRQ